MDKNKAIRILDRLSGAYGQIEEATYDMIIAYNLLKESQGDKDMVCPDEIRTLWGASGDAPMLRMELGKVIHVLIHRWGITEEDIREFAKKECE